MKYSPNMIFDVQEYYDQITLEAKESAQLESIKNELDQSQEILFEDSLRRFHDILTTRATIRACLSQELNIMYPNTKEHILEDDLLLLVKDNLNQKTQ